MWNLNNFSEIVGVAKEEPWIAMILVYSKFCQALLKRKRHKSWRAKFPLQLDASQLECSQNEVDKSSMQKVQV